MVNIPPTRASRPENAPPEADNMGGPNSQGLSTGGEDTASIGLGVRWGDSWPELLEALSEAKAKAQGENEGVQFSWNGHTFLIRPNGHSSGGGKGAFFAYVLEREGIIISMVRRENPSGESPNVRIQIGSATLMELDGLEACWSRAKGLVEALGGNVLWNKLSRVDLCADLPDVDVQELVVLVDARQFICRAKSGAVYWDGRKKTGFVLGKGDIVIRGYDKLHEAKRDQRKWAILQNRRWGKIPDSATRVEFQLRRAALRSFEVDSVEDYLRKRAQVTRYLHSDWIRFTDSEIDPTHTTRYDMHDVWKRVVSAFESWTGKASSGAVRVKHAVQVNAHQLVKQAIGCLVSVVVQESPGELLDYDDFWPHAWERFVTVLGRMNVPEAIARKNLAWVASGPILGAPMEGLAT